MKRLVKAALCSLALVGGAALMAAPAQAHVSIGIGFGGGYYGRPYYGPSYDAYCDPYSRWYDPYRCDEYDNDDYYNGPVFFDGFWFNGPFRSRFHDGRREFFFHNNWRSGTGFHSDGFSHGSGFRRDGGFDRGRGDFHGDFHGGFRDGGRRH